MTGAGRLSQTRGRFVRFRGRNGGRTYCQHRSHPPTLTLSHTFNGIGDIINIVSEIEGGWYFASVENIMGIKTEGIVPCDYVELQED